MANDTLKFCPRCGSAAVDFSELEGGTARCRGCHWSGPNTELYAIPGGSHGHAEAMLVGMMNDLRSIFSKEFGTRMLRFLINWGFLQVNPTDITGTLDRKIFSRYLAAMARGILTAVIEERERQSSGDSPHV